jgi:transposase
LGFKLGRHSTTISNWFKIYNLVGLNGLLGLGHGGGNPCCLNETILAALNKRLHRSPGFGSYGEIQQWLTDEYELEIPYHTVYGIVHYKCNAAPKVVRPTSCEQDLDEVTYFIKKMSYVYPF